MLSFLLICLVFRDCPFILQIQASSSSDVCSVQGVRPRKVKMCVRWCRWPPFIKFYFSWMHWAASTTLPSFVDTHCSMLESVCLRHRKAKLSQVTQHYQWNSTPDSSFPSYKKCSPLLLSTQIAHLVYISWTLIYVFYTWLYWPEVLFICSTNFLLFCWVPVPMLAVRIFKGTITPSLS